MTGMHAPNLFPYAPVPVPGSKDKSKLRVSQKE
jgi:hypothetical protein